MLEVGDFARTKEGVVKIKEINVFADKEGTRYIYETNKKMISSKEILKHSKYLIELIEVGDYVNGYRVVDFDLTYFNGVDRIEAGKKIGVKVDNGQYNCKNYIKKEEIKTILTKEQF